MIKKLVYAAVAVMCTLLALMLLWQLRQVVLSVLISLTIAAALRPLAFRLAGKTLPVRAGWILLYLAVLGVFGLLLVLGLQTAFTEIQQLGITLSAHDAWTLPDWLQTSQAQRTLVGQLPPPSILFEALTGDKGQLVIPALLGFTQNAGDMVSSILVVVFLTIYWSIDQIQFERLWLSLLPAAQRALARRIWSTIELEIGAYIRSEISQSILAALLLALGYWLIGSPYPALLALAGGLAWLVPVVGAPLAVMITLSIGLLNGVQISLFSAAYTLAILVALQFWLEPFLFKRSWDNPILTLVILLAMADAFGLPGMLAAPPISAVCQILWYLLVRKQTSSAAEMKIADLKERQARVGDLIGSMDQPPIPLITNGIGRLAELIEKAEPVLDIHHPAAPAG